VATAAFDGTTLSHVMLAVATASAPAGASQIYKSATGSKLIILSSTGVIAAGESIVLAYSVTADDEVALIALLDLYIAALSTPDGAGYSNIIRISAEVPFDFQSWDKTDRIKTVVAKSTSASDVNYELITVE
jgi:hypothetical protein